MTTIISGSFEQQSAAQQALSGLAEAGFALDQATTFFVNPAGQHDLYPIGGDEKESAGTENAGSGAASGAAVGSAFGIAVGIVTVPVLGPGALVAAAGAGAYAGSLYGALGNLHDEAQPATQNLHAEPPLSAATPRKSGMLVAVCAPASSQQETAIRILRLHGAADIERPEGTIVAGEWTDFNPLTPLHLVAA